MDIVQYILAGIVVGFCVGVTGVGGGSLMTPILISLLKIEPHIAIGTDLLYASISKFCGSMVHAKKLNIVWPIVIFLALGSIPASFATNWVLHNFLSQSPDFKKLLTIVLGFMLLLTGVSIVFRQQIEKFVNRFRKDLPEQPSPEQQIELIKHKKMSMMIMGVVLGVLVTLSSVGAGAFGIMALVLMFPYLPMIRIIGSDVVHAVLLTFVAGLGHMTAGNVDFSLLMWLLVGSIPAIIVGTLLSSSMPDRLIRKILGVTLCLLGINFMLNPVKAKVPAQPKPATALVVASSSR
ncbi:MULTISPECIES: sulfite exporter TauE/SafE family protein [unclassified Acinetobacter]|uniref:sulfite exporter TauE/SafE family protein n=1 Tax=unclassified Acinetobacter TaxID=196816 RepID=UPI0035B82463